jgi:hypothetical protein
VDELVYQKTTLVVVIKVIEEVGVPVVVGVKVIE